MTLNLLMILIIAACIGFLFTEGMWGNAIRLINVVTAALLATNFFEPVAGILEGQAPTFTYLWDFLALWGLFGVFMIVFRALTDWLSRVKVRFHFIADRIGSVFFATWVGWVLVCFTMMSLHTAPLARNFMGGNFQTGNDSRMFFGLAPDRQWLAFTQTVSRGAFSSGASKEDLKKNRYGVREQDEDWERELRVFDRNGEFMIKYATRRANLESYNRSKGALRVRIKKSK